ncbi:MAG: prolyl oligopeptidase family serine peptidase [Planctomycetes bacterium]|nr:prolyl oligopeptidase family serine peptidase [Planctomycetota bacterium]
MLGTSDGIKAMDGNLGPHPKTSSHVTCVVDFYGPSYFLSMDDDAEGEAKNHKHLSSKSAESQLLGGHVYENKNKAISASPITHIRKNHPPFLIVHGSEDPLVPYKQSQRLQEALTQVGVENTLITIDGGGHGHGFGKDAFELVSRFMDHHLQGKKIKWEDHSLKSDSNADKKRRTSKEGRKR